MWIDDRIDYEGYQKNGGGLPVDVVKDIVRSGPTGGQVKKALEEMAGYHLPISLFDVRSIWYLAKLYALYPHQTPQWRARQAMLIPRPNGPAHP